VLGFYVSLILFQSYCDGLSSVIDKMLYLKVMIIYL